MPKNNNYLHDIQLDESNNNTRWQDAIASDLKQQIEYEAYKDLGHKSSTKSPPNFKKIRFYFINYVKPEWCHDSRLVANRHLTNVPLSSTCYELELLKGVRLFLFLVELNGLEPWGVDIANSRVQANTKKNVCVIARPDFFFLKGHMLTMNIDLCGLRASDLSFCKRLAKCFHDMLFLTCKMEPDIWTRREDSKKDLYYEHADIWVDDLLITSNLPQIIMDALITKINFKLDLLIIT